MCDESNPILLVFEKKSKALNTKDTEGTEETKAGAVVGAKEVSLHCKIIMRST